LNYRISSHGHNTYIQCLKCKNISYNPKDILNKYCGSCKIFHEDEEKMEQAERAVNNKEKLEQICYDLMALRVRYFIPAPIGSLEGCYDKLNEVINYCFKEVQVLELREKNMNLFENEEKK
jgi:hypothetical protein